LRESTKSSERRERKSRERERDRERVENRERHTTNIESKQEVKRVE